MFNGLLHYKKHPYREALHTLLYTHPEGLSEVDIADRLNISDADCKELLRLEQIRDAIDADPYSGTLIYKSKRTTQPNLSLSKAIAMARNHRVLTVLEVFTCLSFALISTTLLSINISLNIGSSEKASQQPYSFGKSLDEEFIQSRVDAELAAQRKSELMIERDDLSRRIIQLEAVVINEDCKKSWEQKKSCYTGGRLLTKVEFDRELAEMRFQLSKIDEVLAKYN